MIELLKELILTPLKEIVKEVKDKVRRIKAAFIILYIAVMLNLILTTITLIIVSVK